MVQSLEPPTWPTPTNHKGNPCQTLNPPALDRLRLHPPNLRLPRSRQRALQLQVLMLVSGLSPVLILSSVCLDVRNI